MKTETRRGFWAVLWAVIVSFFSGTQTNAATKLRLDQIRSGVAGPGLMGYGADQIGSPVSVGGGLSLSGGVLSATSTPIPVPIRSYGVALTRDVSGNYPVPIGIRSKTVVWRNGSRQDPADDYSIVTNIVTPSPSYPAWATDDKVIADGE